MNMQIIGSTHPHHVTSLDEALKFAGHSAAICYSNDTFDEIISEQESKTIARIKRTLSSQHHSVYDHTVFNLLLINIPKIVAMVLNNEKDYATSEKSARYTKMKTTGLEAELYTKWIGIFKKEIADLYPEIGAESIEKLAQENARYLTSVFTPTQMEYTVSLRQLNYILWMMRKYITENISSGDPFKERLSDELTKFVRTFEGWEVPDLTPAKKDRKLSLFTEQKRCLIHFGEVYSTYYSASFAQVAQAQRHRTLDYKINVDVENPLYYIPPIIEDNDMLIEDWLRDIRLVSDIFPQGMMVEVIERGTYEDFILKCKERLCGFAQLEIMQQTIKTLAQYHALASEFSGFYTEFAEQNEKVVPRCMIKGYTCTSPCSWGPTKAFLRKI